jgi:benzoate 4-monooxygenase
VVLTRKKNATPALAQAEEPVDKRMESIIMQMPIPSDPQIIVFTRPIQSNHRPNTVYFNEPQAVNDIYGHKAASKMIKDTFYDRLAGDYHDIVQERDRGEHSRKRKCLAHAFALKTVVEMEPVIRANAMNLIARTEDFIDDMAGHTGGSSETFNVRAWLNYFTLDVIGGPALGDILRL